MTDEDFIVWMRIAAFPDFRKLYRIIPGDLKQGDYVLEINNTYPVGGFGGKKGIILSTTTWIGGKNLFLGISYLSVGGLCLLLGIAFALKYLGCPRRVGDPSQLKYFQSLKSQNSENFP